MPVMPINNLQDLLLIRELKNRANPTFSAFKSIADGVALGISEAQEAAKLKKQQEEKNAAEINQFKNLNNSTTGQMEYKLHRDKEGNYYTTGSTERKATESARIKSEKQIEEIRQREEVMDLTDDYINDRIPYSKLVSNKFFTPDDLTNAKIKKHEMSKYNQEVSFEKPTDGYTYIRSVGEVPIENQEPQMTKIPKDMFMTTELNVDTGEPSKIQNVAKDIFIKQQDKLETRISDVLGDNAKAGIKVMRDMSRINAGMSVAMSYVKQVKNEQGGFTLPNKIYGDVNRSLAKLGLIDTSEDLSKAQSGVPFFQAQRIETILGLNPILTNQNRVIEGIVRMLGITYPDLDKPMTETELVGLLKQTYRNAFNISVGLSKLGVTREDIVALENGDDEAIEVFGKKLQNVMGSLGPDAEKLFEMGWQEIKDTPANIPETLDSQSTTDELFKEFMQIEQNKRR